MKTLAIRLDDELHARLSVIAQLSESTITDEIRQAIEAHLERKSSSDEFTSKAQAVLDDIEREANAKRAAITTMLGTTGTTGTTGTNADAKPTGSKRTPPANRKDE